MTSVRTHLPERIFSCVFVRGSIFHFPVSTFVCWRSVSVCGSLCNMSVCVCVCDLIFEWPINHADGSVCWVVGSRCSGRIRGPGTGPRQEFPQDTHTYALLDTWMDTHTHRVRTIDVNGQLRHMSYLHFFFNTIKHFLKSTACF